ncbi:uncharacterized protein IWZ02DRAFT_280436 [Phyllosticta citriasiana]|uniref:Uncharacterized protein n=1 Tax=Phyllosticta citriasiana TaxID=595635 RepID=A0ABR1L2Q9_9PEZI
MAWHGLPGKPALPGLGAAHMRRRRFNTTSITDFSSQSQMLRGPSGRHQSKRSPTRVGKRITDRQTRWLSWLGPLVCPTTRYTTRLTQHPTSRIQHQTNRNTAPTNREANSPCSATSMYDAPFARPRRQTDRQTDRQTLPASQPAHAVTLPRPMHALHTHTATQGARETEKKRGSASPHPPHTHTQTHTYTRNAHAVRKKAAHQTRAKATTTTTK